LRPGPATSDASCCAASTPRVAQPSRRRKSGVGDASRKMRARNASASRSPRLRRSAEPGRLARPVYTMRDALGINRVCTRPVPTAGGYTPNPAARSTFMGVPRALDLNSLRAIADSSFFPRMRV